MPWPKQKKARDQRRKRRQKHEYAFLFTAGGHLLGEVERVQWEVALADCGGDVAEAATACGLTDIPKGAKALWGRSAEAAWSTYRHWQRLILDSRVLIGQTGCNRLFLQAFHGGRDRCGIFEKSHFISRA